jgi:hypothetical protein
MKSMAFFQLPAGMFFFFLLAKNASAGILVITFLIQLTGWSSPGSFKESYRQKNCFY